MYEAARLALYQHANPAALYAEIEILKVVKKAGETDPKKYDHTLFTPRQVPQKAHSANRKLSICIKIGSGLGPKPGRNRKNKNSFLTKCSLCITPKFWLDPQRMYHKTDSSDGSRQQEANTKAQRG